MLWKSLINLFAPRLDWVQVEVTTHCQAACSYCPHTAYREHWESRHLAMDTWRRLLPVLKRARMVHLQGWGEPLLHPDFFTMVSLARQAGCQVGTTTNGMLLDADSLRRLVDLEVAVVAFSLAGVGENNDLVRRGTRFGQVLRTIEALNTAKARKGSLLPKVHVAYMALRSRLHDLALLPQALAGLGVSQVVVSTLDYVASPALAQESLSLLTPEETREFAARLKELADRGRRQGLDFYYSLPSLEKAGPVCPENAARALVVSAAMSSGPPQQLGLPIASGAPRGLCPRTPGV